METHPSVESLIHRCKSDSRAMSGLRSLCQGLSLPSTIPDDEVIEKIALCVRTRRVLGFKKSDKKKKGKSEKDKNKSASAAAATPPPSNPKVARIRISGDEWEFHADAYVPDDPKAVEITKAHPWIDPYLEPCRLDHQAMAAFRRLNQFLAIAPAQGAVAATPAAGAAQVPDAELLKRIVEGLKTKQLRAFRVDEEDGGGGSSPPPPEAAPAPAPPPPAQAHKEEEPDPDTFGDNHDAAKQAAALEAAAASGAPFCEECEKKKQAAA